jgi:uncharacterized membrane protein YraQ (UPF0718 family)
VFWPLVLGFALSGAVQAVVSRRSMALLLGDDSPRSLSFATLFGAASSSCSYAAVALARSIFRKGASFAAAMVFEIASTNLVIELGIILIVLMGRQFAAAEFAGGFVIAGALAAWVPESFWQRFFLTGHPTLAKIEGPLVGPLVAIVSFVCSVGNVPLAAVLRQGGISFGGVVSFIFADLIVLPILDIYRRYYGSRVALYLLATFYVTMAAAGYVVEFLFGALGIIPEGHTVARISEGPSWNYTTALNAALLLLSAGLVWRFLRTGGPAMVRMMGVHASME